MKKILAVLAGKITLAIIQLANLGAGGTWPGEIALIIYPQILEALLRRTKTIFVAGTNGKTTTAKLISDVLNEDEKSSVNNTSGANLTNGLVTSALSKSSFLGNLTSDFAVFEIDEGFLPQVLSQKMPDILLLLNLFRDQLDRYGEVDAIAEKWLQALSNLNLKNTTLIVNADDPHLAFIGLQLKSKAKEIIFFGLENQKFAISKMQHATDSTFCPRCGHELNYSTVYFSHLGIWNCPHCHLSHPKNNTSDIAVTHLLGTYNQYNLLAVSAVTDVLNIQKPKVTNAIANFSPAFGRQEEIVFGGKKIKILLSKNPTGFNESLRTATANGAKSLMLVLNDRVPDGRDISWIWDVDFEEFLPQSLPIYIGGERVDDLAVRLKYVGATSVRSFSDLKAGLNAFADGLSKGQTGWVLPTYTAMLQTRKILTGQEIL